MIIQKTPETALPFHASKWLHTQFLVDVNELAALFQRLDSFSLFSTMSVRPIGENRLTKEQFLDCYGTYVATLQAGKVPNDDEYRFMFTALLTSTESALQSIQVAGNREMIRPIAPIIQLQLHRFDISPDDGKVRPMVFGKGTHSWGLQASYPQLFADPLTSEVYEVLKEERFQNNALFREFQKWVREYTMPTPLQIRGNKVNATIRIGKNSLHWSRLRYD
jgi:hypothetical protein